METAGCSECDQSLVDPHDRRLHELVRDSGLCPTHYLERSRVRRAEKRERERAAWAKESSKAQRFAMSAYGHKRRARLRGNSTFEKRRTDRPRQLERQRWGCFYCGARLAMETAQEEHVVPIARGGCDGVGNIVYVCKRCNSSKKDRTIMEWRMATLRRGTRNALTSPMVSV